MPPPGISSSNQPLSKPLDSRTFLPPLRTLLSQNIRTLIWAGDADWICNWFGSHACANTLGSASFASTPLAPYTVNGVQGGEYKTEGNLAFIRVWGAGHEVPYYTPALALQVFQQVMGGGGVVST